VDKFRLLLAHKFSICRIFYPTLPDPPKFTKNLDPTRNDPTRLRVDPTRGHLLLKTFSFLTLSSDYFVLSYSGKPRDRRSIFYVTYYKKLWLV